MFKKLASIFLAATMVAGTTAVVANAAESESAVSADSSSQVGADSSLETDASKVIYFDVKSAGWDTVNGIATTKPVFCHIFSYYNDGKTYTGWQSKGEKCAYDASTGIATYDISTGIKKGADGLETIDDTNKWVVMFSNKTGAETYTLLLNSSCWGDTVVADPNTMLENNVDSEKQSMKISWKNNKNLSSPICITSTGKIQGDTYAAGDNAETVVSQFLVEYYGSKYCTDDNVKKAFDKLGADPAKTIELAGYKINERLEDGIITDQAVADQMFDAIINQVCKLADYGQNDETQWSFDDNGVLTISGNGDMPNFDYTYDIPWSDCCELIKKVVIENGVTSIGERAFVGCSELTSITIPNSVTSIGSYAFRNCSELTSITIPNSVTSIGSYAFRDCSKLTSITMANSVTSIGNGAFCYCSELTSITIPDSVTSIGGGAFSGCNSLTDVYYQGTQEQWKAITFYNLDCFGDATIHFVGESSNLNSIGDVNLDGKINILDVTAIQKHLAQIITLENNALALADTNADDKINILDATQIQKYLAHIIPEL